MNIQKHFESVREHNNKIREQRLNEVYEKLPEVKALDDEMRAAAFARGQIVKDIQARVKELASRKAALLTQNGYSADYLDAIYSCAGCKDTGYTGDTLKTPCRCAMALNAREQEREYGMKPTDASFEQFDLNVFPEKSGQRARMHKLMDITKKYVQAFPNNPRPNMLITGNAGLGKSYILECVANAVYARGYSVIRVNSNRFFELFRRRMFEASLDSRINMFYRCDLLALDDLGVEPMLNNITAESLYDVLNQRLINKKASVIVSNLDANSILNRYGERVSSRLADKREFVYYNLEGEDIRSVRPL
jgi:DNA replication protein DnaC